MDSNRAQENVDLRVDMDEIVLVTFEPRNIGLGDKRILDSNDLVDIHRTEDTTVHNIV